MLNVVQRAARHQHLLSDLDDLEQLGADWNRGRPCCRLPFAACGARVHGHRDIRLRQRGASLVPSPVMATKVPFRLVVADHGEFVLRSGFGEEVIDAASAAMAPR
jgi:hypothetical protein